MLFDIAERRGATTVALSATQEILLQTIYDQFRARTVWPTVYAVDRDFMKKVKRRNVLSAATMLRDLPEGLIARGTSRSLAGPQETIVPTISAVARCARAEPDVEAFLRAVRWCAAQELKRDPEPGSTSVKVDRVQMQRAIPKALRPDRAAMDRLFALLHVHYWGNGGSCVPSDGSPWYIELGQDVRRFARVQSVEDFINTRISWYETEAERHPMALTAHAFEPEAQPETQPRAYLNPKILEQLRAITGTAWDITKLVTVATELDFCVCNGYVFAAHGLLRTLLDHVPPLFGQKGFAGVMASHTWGQTDKRYMRKLGSFRDQADDALHRQISKRPDLLMIDDLPEGAAVNVLLQECISQLQKP